MSTSSSSRSFENQKRFRSVSYTLVFLMMACVVLTTSILVHNLLPDWRSSVMAGILLFVLVDRLYTYRHMKSLTFLSREWVMTLGAQWVVIGLCSRILLSYVNGPDALIADLALFARGDAAAFFTPEFVITLILAFVMWVLPAQFLELLDEIGLDMKIALQDDQAPIQSDVVPAHQRMAGLVFTTGVVLVILTAMTRLNLRNILDNTAGMPSVELSRFSGAEAGALLYFVFGLALLSLSRLMSLQTHWNRLHIPVSSANLPRQWAMYSLFFLLALALVVSLLPAGGSLGLISVVGTLLRFLAGVFLFLAQLLIGLLLMLVSLPFLLFGQPPPFMPGSAPPVAPTLPTQPISPPTNNEFFELLRSIVLWGALIVIIVYAFVRFVRQHDQILATLRRARVANWLRLAWQWLYHKVNQAGGSVVSAIKDGWQGIVSRLDGKRILSRQGWISVRALDPRRRVYFFYLAMIRRAGEHGVTRERSQTPFEYAAQLEKEIPSANQEIDSLTEAFVHARYSRREIDLKEANMVKAAWDRIRRALQDKAKKDISTKS